MESAGDEPPPELPSALPSAESARVPRDKIVHYLLDPTSEQGRDKALWFHDRLGYERYHHERLRQELTRSAVTGSVVSCRPTKVGGLTWAVRAKIGGPNGQQHFVTAVWFVRIAGAAPVLVTAYPGP